MAKNVSAIIKSRIAVIIALLIILFIGNKLREFNYASVPLPGEVADEYSFGWLGLSLIKDHYPSAWSNLSPYKDREIKKIYVDSIYDRSPATPPFPIVKPWFDHPPLFGLITGGYAYLKGARDFESTSVILLRRPMLKIAIVTTILIFILGYTFFKVEVGLLASLLYSVVPTFVISSRLALSENAYIPIFIAVLILSRQYLKTRNNKIWILACVLLCVALLIKLWAASIALALLGIAIIYGKNNKKFMILSVLAFAIVGILLFALYGALINWQIFTQVLTANSSRFYGAGAEIVWQIFNGSRLTTSKFLSDGWIIFGWISFLVLTYKNAIKSSETGILLIGVFSYLTVFILFGSESYGWYKFPFFPVLAVSLAKVIWDLYEKPNILFSVLMFLLPIGTAFHRLVGIMDFQQYANYLRFFAPASFLVFLSAFIDGRKGLAIQRVFIVLLLTFSIIVSIKLIFFYTIDKWYFVS